VCALHLIEMLREWATTAKVEEAGTYRCLFAALSIHHHLRSRSRYLIGGIFLQPGNNVIRRPFSAFAAAIQNGGYRGARNLCQNFDQKKMASV